MIGAVGVLVTRVVTAGTVIMFATAPLRASYSRENQPVGTNNSIEPRGG
jgi:hypothetical protein